MARAPYRAAFFVVAGLIGAATLGFTTGGGTTPDSQGASPRSARAATGEAASVEALPRSGTALLLYTGEQRGHLEPCGCTQPQIGGLPRRAAFLASLSSGLQRVVVDNGDMVEDPGRQSQL